MAGAASVLTDATLPAPTAAARKNFRRCMVSSQDVFFTLRFDSTPRHQSGTAARCLQQKAPPKRGFSNDDSAAYPSLLPADMRAMKLSNVFSTTRNHRTSSLRKGFHA